jgi:hypothetical protein
MYKRIRNSDFIQRLSDGAFIPPSDGNADYEECKAWQAAGNELLPADPAPPLTQAELDAEFARQYAKLKALRDMTPQQIATWVDNNIITLDASAKDAIKTLAIAVGILARRI